MDEKIGFYDNHLQGNVFAGIGDDKAANSGDRLPPDSPGYKESKAEVQQRLSMRERLYPKKKQMPTDE